MTTAPFVRMARPENWNRRLVTVSLASVLVVAALTSFVALARELQSPSVAGATTTTTVTVAGTTGPCSSGWFNSASIDVPAGVLSTQVTMTGGGGGGSTPGGSLTVGGAGGSAATITTTISATALPAGSQLWTHLGCGGGAGTAVPAGGQGGAGENAAGATTDTGAGASGGSAEAPATGANGAGGGGGASALCVGTSTDCAGGILIGVAGGGGGGAAAVSSGTPTSSTTANAGGQGAAANTSDGGAGAPTPSANCPPTCTGGGGGTSTQSGGAGTSASNNGTAGSGGTGGVGASGNGPGNGQQNAAGGGGGGGYFGGGGGAEGQTPANNEGASGSGGGAGSSYWNSSFGSPAYSTVSVAPQQNCTASPLSNQCVDSTTANGSGGSAGNTGASGSLVVTFTVVGPATQLVFTQEPPTSPTTVTAGQSIAPAVQVALEDADGNVMTTDSSSSVTLTFASNLTGATLSNASVTLNQGVATFSSLSVNLTGIYTLSASSSLSGITGTVSTSFSVTAGAATQLGFTQEPPTSPSTATAGQAITPAVQVSLEDAEGNVVTTDSSSSVTLSFASNLTGATLSNASVTFNQGIATFSSLSVNLAGTYSLSAASSLTNVTAATSTSFSVTAGAATHLVFTQEPPTVPTEALAGEPITPAVQVSLEDAQGNIVTSDSSSTVTLSFAYNPTGATLSNAAVTLSLGVATFSSLSVNLGGTFTLSAASSAPAVTAATSTVFSVTGTQLVFTQEPPTSPNTATAGQSIAPAVQVSLEDAQGNVVTGASGTVSLGFGSNPMGATLSNGSVTLSQGVASFSSLSVNLGGTYTLTASTSVPTVSPATSTSFTVTGAQLVFTQEPPSPPDSAAAGLSIIPVVQVSLEDAQGNVVTTASGTVSLGFGSNPTSATLSNAAVTLNQGVATFSSLSVNLAGIYTLDASTNLSGVAGATSTSFSVTTGQVMLSQSSAVPLDYLGSSLCTAGTTTGIVLNGQEQTACGRVTPVTVTNNSGLASGWTLTGQISDFTDSANATLTCDTVPTYNNHCIPGGDMGWIPQASVNSVLSGISAQVQPGSPIDPSAILAPGSIGPSPPGLNASPQILCQAPANMSEGEFTCGADIVLPVPASIATTNSPGFQATLTLTLF